MKAKEHVTRNRNSGINDTDLIHVIQAVPGRCKMLPMHQVTDRRAPLAGLGHVWFGHLSLRKPEDIHG
ncbi:MULTISPECIES: hypothetical protein [Roseobacter]|uniref:hypothetical protein n=1 Tax=Roseobacter TaxID=2433 RepID=UPI00031CDC4A|nr:MULTISPECIES: hypothetical protein [Roseobacter]